MDSRQTPASRRTAAGAAARTVIVVALLAVAAVGLRAREAARPVATAGPLARHAVALAFTVAAVGVLFGVALLVALALTLRPAKEDEEQPALPVYGTRWSRPLALLAGLAVIGVVVALVLVSTRTVGGQPGGGGVTPAGSDTSPSVPARPGAGDRTSTHGSWLPTVALGGVAVLAVAAAFGLGRFRRPASDPVGSPATVTEPDLEPEVLRSAVRDAQQTLAGSGQDARSAIVACYDAMERALADAGAAPRAADTPSEVLARIAAVNPAAARPAGGLTALFREARYSVHPVDESHREAARAALVELRDLLEVPQ